MAAIVSPPLYAKTRCDSRHLKGEPQKINVHIFVYYKYGYPYCHQKILPDAIAIDISHSCNKQCDRLMYCVQSFGLKVGFLHMRKVWNFKRNINAGMIHILCSHSIPADKYSSS